MMEWDVFEYDMNDTGLAVYIACTCLRLHMTAFVGKWTVASGRCLQLTVMTCKMKLA